MAVLRRADSRVRTLRERGGRRQPGAGITRHDARVGDRLRAVQLDDVRRTQRVLIRATEADVPDRRPLHLELVGVRWPRGRVARAPVAGVEYQLPGPRRIL